MSDKKIPENITLRWESGTAYELFVSLYVLHKPEHFGIRASWAAGIRSRIPASERKLLEEVIEFIGIPLKWIHSLGTHNDAVSVLWSLKQIPASERPMQMFVSEDMDNVWNRTLVQIMKKQAWDQNDLADLNQILKEKGETDPNDEKLSLFLDRLADPENLGEGLLAALQAYYQAFFEEEEKRLKTVLEAGLERAKELATQMDIQGLITELSQGVNLEEILCCENLVIVPAYWTTPLVLYTKSDENTLLFLFGARPADMAAIPGETVPDGLLRALKALSDPTRLKILYYLSQEELNASELSRRLRLRAPTVTHHLNELRLSGMVNLTIHGQEKQYRTREEAIDSMVVTLKDFLHTSKPDQ